MRVKIFSASPKGPVWSPKTAEAAVEEAINRWLADHPAAKVVSVCQSATSGFGTAFTLVVSVWYEPGTEPSAPGQPPS